MTRKLLVVSFVVFATIPAAAAVAGTSSARAGASKQCVTVQAKLGAVAFERVFPSFSACVSTLTPLARAGSTGALAACRSERASAAFAGTHGGKSFAKVYGTGPKRTNAFGRCVAAKERMAAQALVAAAVACRSAQSEALGANAVATCLAAKAQPTFTVSPVQPTPVAEPQQQGTKAGVVVGGCGPPETGGPPRPQIAGCLVAGVG